MIIQDVKAISSELGPTLFENRKFLVTGGAGFLGSWLCETVLSSGGKVYCIDNVSTGSLENVHHLRRNKRFILRRADVTKNGRPREKLHYILHFASRTSPEDYQKHPIDTLLTNSAGTEKTLELARRNDSVLLNASSSEVYGNSEVVPTPETYFGHVNPIGPRSCYDEGKRFGEALCIAYHKTYGLDIRIARIFNSYGPRMRADGAYARAVPRFIRQALAGEDITVYGDGYQTRSFCYVTDAITAILKTLQTPSMKGEVVNIGNPEEISILTLAEKIKSLTNSKSRIIFHPHPQDDPQRRCPDITKAKEKLKWQPSVTLEEGLRKTISSYRQRS